MTIMLRYSDTPGASTDRGYDLVNDNGIQTEDGLETAVIISLFTDARATPAELEIAGLKQDHLGGWWGDSYPEIDGDVTGSKLWLLARAKRVQSTLDLAVVFASQALQWLLTDKVAATVTPFASWHKLTGLLVIRIEIQRPGDLEPKWVRVWNAISGEAVG